MILNGTYFSLMTIEELTDYCNLMQSSIYTAEAVALKERKARIAAMKLVKKLSELEHIEEQARHNEAELEEFRNYMKHKYGDKIRKAYEKAYGNYVFKRGVCDEKDDSCDTDNSDSADSSVCTVSSDDESE